MTDSPELALLIQEILKGGDGFLGGVHVASEKGTELLTAVVNWSKRLGRTLDEVIAVVEPCLRQSILFSLLPVDALLPATPGASIDTAIEEHLNQLRLSLSQAEKEVLRNICINYRRLHGVSRTTARSRTMGIAELRADKQEFQRVMGRQNERCCWCGVSFDGPVQMTLEHLAPKHLGDDPPASLNWAIACKTCNEGKGDALAWAATPAAHDYLGRNHLLGANVIHKTHRWAVLMRTRKCDRCGVPAKRAELIVYRRTRTGLPIPVHCSVACEPCLIKNGLERLQVDWATGEGGRVPAAFRAPATPLANP